MYELINFSVKGDYQGSLVPIEGGQDIPFGIDGSNFFLSCDDCNVEKVIANPINWLFVERALANLKKQSIILLQKALLHNCNNNGRLSKWEKRLLVCFKIKNTTDRRKYMLFGVFPIIRIKYKNNQKKYYLFNVLPIYQRENEQ